MPKRVPTPPPGDNEPRYLTVVHPYAVSGTCNMELPKDRQDFARWVVCCIDKNAFFAIFHKPSSRGMVIIEINKEFEHFDRILGEHRWSEFLQKPTKEESGRATKVFYCTYNTGRIVQKNGWKRIDVDEAWFKAWSPNNKYIKYPYPATRFCDVPVEDRTNLPMCRPLPGAVKTPPPADTSAPPVVGSAEWIETKGGVQPSAPATTQSKSNTLGAWGKAPPKIQPVSAKSNPTANGSTKKTIGIPQRSHTGAKLPAVMGGPIVVKSNNVWENIGKKSMSVPVPVMASWDGPEPVTRDGTPVLPATLPATTRQAPAAALGLPARETAWGSDATSNATQPPNLARPAKIAAPATQDGADRIVNFSNSSWGSTSVSVSSPDSDSGPDLTPATESDNPYAYHIHFSESMEEDFHGMEIRTMDEYNDELRGLDVMAPGAWDEPTGVEVWETTDGADWGNEELEAEDLWRQNQEPAKPMLCKAHGVICKKGICAEYAKQVRSAKRTEEAEQRKAAIANRGKKASRAKGRGAGKKHDENESTDKNKPQNSQFRGPGAPVRTNWRGAPRAIVSADTIEQRETTKADSDDGWGNSDSEVDPKATAADVSTGIVDAASDASWGVPENAYDPWAAPAKPVTEKGSSGKPQGKKKPGQPKPSNSWADQVDAELAGDPAVVTSKRGSRRGTSTTGWASSTAKSSSSGWGSVAQADMPW